MKFLLYLLLSFFLMILSTNIEGLVTIYDNSEGCRNGCKQLALGLPFPFFYDSPYLSPANAVSLDMVLTGDDTVHWRNFIISYLFWIILSVGLFKLKK